MYGSAPSPYRRSLVWGRTLRWRTLGVWGSMGRAGELRERVGDLGVGRWVYEGGRVVLFGKG